MKFSFQVRVCLLSLLLAAAALGQEFRSTLSGQVLDPQQSAVPGAKVVAVQIETGSRAETVTGENGRYALPYLMPGGYRIEVEAAGFKRHVRDDVGISANERVAINFTLEIGEVSENVTVTADAPLLETATGSVGMVLTSRQVENIPINGRTPLMLAQLSATVIPMGAPVMNRPFDNANTADFSVAGAPARTNDLLMDGSPNATRNLRSAYSPPMESVQEMKVEAFQSDAAFGSTGGGTINMVTKAGTNRYHGAAYDYNQITKTAATPFFINRSGQEKPSSLWNQYGVTAGGPVRIPRVFNGTDKLFFFFSFEGIKQPTVFSLGSTVPTEAMRRGDLSQLLKAGSAYQIYDPATGVREGARVRRQPFPNNIIPTSRISPVAQKAMPYWSLPNQPGTIDGRNNFFTNAPGYENYNNELGRLDYNVSARHKMFFTVRQSERYNNSQSYFRNEARGRNLIRPAWGMLFDDVYTFTPTLLLNTRVNWTSFTETIRPLSEGMSLTGLGFPASVEAASPLLQLPRMDVGSYERLGENNGARTPFNSYQLFSSMTKILSRHSVKAGVEIRLFRESGYSAGNSSGRYTFNNNWTRGPLDSAAAAPIGQDFAAFLLGLPSGGSFDLNAYRSAQATYTALFVQDDFRVSRSLTLNLGLRYERDTATTERYNRLTAGFDAAAKTAVTDKAKAAYAGSPIPEVPAAQFNPVGGLLFASADHRSGYQTRPTNFSPRFGFAWTPPGLGGNTVLRGGFGIFYFDLGIASTNQLGFSQSTPFVATQDGNLTPYATLSNPFPDGIQQPTGSTLGVNTLLGTGVSYYNTNPKNAYSARWNLNVQRMLASNLMIEASYIGNKAVRMQVDRQLNFTPRNQLSTAPERDQATIDRLSASVTNPFAGLLPGTNLNGSVVSRSQLMQLYPQFTGVNSNGFNDGSSWSHMGVLRVEKRFSHGLEMQANVQYSRIMQRMSRLNDSDPFLEKRVAAEDRPVRAVVSASYTLPFGRGQRFGASARGVLNQVIGGWLLSGYHTYSVGQPLEWGNAIYLGGSLRPQPRNLEAAFDTTRFNTNSRTQLAQNVRLFPTAFANIRGDGVNGTDLSIIKDFPIVERVKLQYRCEFFNALNHPQFDLPDVSPTSSAFGKISNQLNLPRRVQMALRLVW